MAVAAAMAQLQPAEVQYVGAESPLRAYRLGDECFVPVELLSTIGWDATLNKDQVKVEFAGATRYFPHRTFAGSQSIPFRRAMQEFGGDTEWDRIGRVLDARAIGKFTASGLQFSIPVSGVVLDGGKTLEIRGAKIIASPAEVPMGLQIKQSSEGVRLVSATLPWESFDNGPRVIFAVPTKVQVPKATEKVVPIVAPTASPINDPIPITRGDFQKVNPPIQVGDATVMDLEISPDSELTSLLKVKTLLPLLVAPRMRLLSPTTFELEFPKLILELNKPSTLGPDLKLVSVRTVDNDSVITFESTRPMGLEMWTDATGITIQMVKPSLAGKIAGKVIVVDAGHGGVDGGARAGTVQEKQLTLRIASELSERLKQAGATVIMTRKTDVAVALDRRAAVANSNKADLFVSVHINSSARPTVSGSMTFFHGPNAMKELLARCIQTEIAKIDGIPSIGVKSDKTIYKSGFAVLRQSKMPGVLLELGFINHPNDRARMVKPDYASKVATAVVTGLKEFIGDAK
jgi:N-acetylmuramoyl-L-alanine amidase